MNPDPFQHAQSGADLIPAGPLQAEQISYAFAIYYLPKPSADPFATLDALLAREFREFHHADCLSGDETEPTVNAWITADPQHDCPPPSPDIVQLFGRGVSLQQTAALQATEAALVLNFVYPKGQALSRLRTALRLTGELASGTGGLIWDNETREVFTPAAWIEMRIDQWNGPTPDISDHTVIHAYQPDGHVRLVTLGMAKFGLPDVVVNQLPRSVSQQVGDLVSAFCQAITDGPVVERRGEFDLDVRRIGSAGTGTAPLTLKVGTPEAGDPDNRILELTFDRGTGEDVHTRRHAVLAAAFGSGSPVVPTMHDDALNAASEQARSKLPALRALFNDGLAPGEFLQLKAPFEGAGGIREWMWVEVASWTDDAITGFLVNEPASSLDLHAGQTVEVAESTVFDYMHKRSDGVIDGNETERLIRSRLN